LDVEDRLSDTQVKDTLEQLSQMRLMGSICYNPIDVKEACTKAIQTLNSAKSAKEELLGWANDIESEIISSGLKGYHALRLEQKLVRLREIANSL